MLNARSLRCLLTVRAWRCRCRVRWHWVCLGSRAAGVFADPSQRIPEPANAIPESLSKFRQLPRAEDEQGNHQDENQVCWLEQAFHFETSVVNLRITVGQLGRIVRESPRLKTEKLWLFL